MQKSEKFISTSETEQRTLQNFQIVFFVKKTILWTLGKQYWEPPPKIFDQKLQRKPETKTSEEVFLDT